jgi:hypothetical protein
MLDTKICSHCGGDPKPINEFAKDGAHAWCRSCANTYSATYRAANLDKIRSQQRETKRLHPARHLLSYAKTRAVRLGVPFALCEKDIVIPTHCPVLGLKLEPNPSGNGQWPASPTLDRIIPGLGYVASNVEVVSWRANQLKSNGTLDELERVTAWLRERPVGRMTKMSTYVPTQGHPNRRALPQDRESLIAEQYKTGMTMVALATENRCATSTISEVLHRLGVPIRPPVAWRKARVA